MTITNLHTLSDSASDPNSEFKQLRYKILSEFEGIVPTPYFDTKGIITIGIGFNIDTVPDNLNLVMGTLGMNLNSTQQGAILDAWNSPTMDEIRALQELKGSASHYLRSNHATPPTY